MSGGIFVIAFLFVGIPGDAHAELEFLQDRADWMEIGGYREDEKPQSLAKGFFSKPNMTSVIPFGVRSRRALESTALPSKQELKTKREVFLIRLASNDIQMVGNSNEFFLSLDRDETKRNRLNDEHARTKVCFVSGAKRRALKWSKVVGKSENTFYLELQTHVRKPRYLAVLDSGQSIDENSPPSLGLNNDMSKAVEWRTVPVDDKLVFLLVVKDHSSVGADATGLFISTQENDEFKAKDDDSKGFLNLALGSYFPVGLQFIPASS